MCVSDLQDGDVPAEALQGPGHLAAFQPLFRRQTLQLLVKRHGCRRKKADRQMRGTSTSKEFSDQKVNRT